MSFFFAERPFVAGSSRYNVAVCLIMTPAWLNMYVASVAGRARGHGSGNATDPPPCASRFVAPATPLTPPFASRFAGPCVRMGY